MTMITDMRIAALEAQIRDLEAKNGRQTWVIQSYRDTLRQHGIQDTPVPLTQQYIELRMPEWQAALTALQQIASRPDDEMSRARTLHYDMRGWAQEALDKITESMRNRDNKLSQLFRSMVTQVWQWYDVQHGNPYPDWGETREEVQEGATNNLMVTMRTLERMGLKPPHDHLWANSQELQPWPAEARQELVWDAVEAWLLLIDGPHTIEEENQALFNIADAYAKATTF